MLSQENDLQTCFFFSLKEVSIGCVLEYHVGLVIFSTIAFKIIHPSVIFILIHLQRVKRKSRCLNTVDPIYLSLSLSISLSPLIITVFPSLTVVITQLLNAYNFGLRSNSAKLIRTFIGQFLKDNSMGPRWDQ